MDSKDFEYENLSNIHGLPGLSKRRSLGNCWPLEDIPLPQPSSRSEMEDYWNCISLRRMNSKFLRFPGEKTRYDL